MAEESNIDVFEILQGDPEEKVIDNFDLPTVDKSDFREVEEAEEIEEEITPDEETIEDHTKTQETVNDPPPTRKQELEQETDNFKNELLALIKPETIVKFLDKGIAFGGSKALKKSTKDDWRLDDEDIELLADILTVLMKEEDILNLPAKYWLIIALVFIYAMKGEEVYSKYYTQGGMEIQAPHEHLAEVEIKAAAHSATMKAKLLEAQMMEEEAEVEARIYKAKISRDNHLSPDDAEKFMRAEGFAAVNGNGSQTEEIIKKSKPGVFTVNKGGKIIMHEDYPSEIYVYHEDLLVLKNDGTPRKRPGNRKDAKLYRHKVSLKFIPKEEYDLLYPDEKEPDEVIDLTDQTEEAA